MNLKYYLRGLGIGIIVTALILGIHYSRKNSAMTDAQIKERAAQLGMVESTTLKSTEDDDVKNAEELLNELNNETTTVADDTASKEADDTNTEIETAIDNLEASVDEIEQQTDELLGNENEVELPVTDAEDDPGRKNTNETDSTVIEAQETEAETVVEEDETPAEESESESNTPADGKTVTITIVSGDSSYSVAKKLVDAGLVLDASEYDLYLCNNGYDRKICTGKYEIAIGTSNEAIAKLITGR